MNTLVSQTENPTVNVLNPTLTGSNVSQTMKFSVAQALPQCYQLRFLRTMLLLRNRRSSMA